MNSPLDLTLAPDQMHALGLRALDLVISHFTSIRQQRVARVGDRETLAAAGREPIPERGVDLDSIFERLRRDVFGNMMHLDHPRFFGFVSSPSNFVSVIADLLATGLNPFAGTWLEAAGPAQIELATIGWLKRLLGLPDAAGGTFVAGGSMANLTALAVARHVVLQGHDTRDAVVYLSDQTHSSNERGLRLLGFSASQVRKIPSDEAFRLAPQALCQHIEADLRQGRKPFCVIANAGTTNTGAVDPLVELRAICRRYGLWLHADGAFGAAAALTAEGQDLLRGIGDADSLAVDPHKWLFQPYETGVVLLRDVSHLRAAFHVLPEYLQDTETSTGEVNFCEYGIQLTRSFRALKMWLSLQVFGLAAFRDAVARGMELARQAEREIRSSPATWEIVTPAQLGIVTFRFVGQGGTPGEIDTINERIAKATVADGFCFVSSTRLRGRTVLRLCTINPRTTDEDIVASIQQLERLAQANSK